MEKKTLKKLTFFLGGGGWGSRLWASFRLVLKKKKNYVTQIFPKKVMTFLVSSFLCFLN